MKKNIQLTKIILASLIISVALVLFQINFVYGEKYFGFNKMPINKSNWWNFWYLPLIFLCLFFSLKDVVFFLFVYIVLDISLYSGPKCLQSIEFLQKGEPNIGTIKTFTFLVFYGSFIPILAYIFIAIFMDLRKNNCKKIIICFILIVLVQSISRSLSGYLYWSPGIEKALQNANYTTLLDWWKKGTSTTKFIFIWVSNLIPILTSNIINFIVFFIIKKRVIKTYDLYFENYSFKQNISKS